MTALVRRGGQKVVQSNETGDEERGRVETDGATLRTVTGARRKNLKREAEEGEKKLQKKSREKELDGESGRQGLWRRVGGGPGVAWVSTLGARGARMCRWLRSPGWRRRWQARVLAGPPLQLASGSSQARRPPTPCPLGARGVSGPARIRGASGLGKFQLCFGEMLNSSFHQILRSLPG